MSDSVVVIREPTTAVVVKELPNIVKVTTPGPQGPPGPTGPPGGERFVFEQATPASSWVINHGLNTYPGVVLNVGSEEVTADVFFNSLDQVTVSFLTPTAGTAVLS